MLEVENSAKKNDIISMTDFQKGMSTVGQLFPLPTPYNYYPPKYSEWRGVANAFHFAGYSLWLALEEFSNAQRENKQTP
jgi:hypothetical protein